MFFKTISDSILWGSQDHFSILGLRRELFKAVSEEGVEDFGGDWRFGGCVEALEPLQFTEDPIIKRNESVPEAELGGFGLGNE
jgi:hypothetical protein